MTVADITGGMALEEVRSQEIVARWEDIALEKVHTNKLKITQYYIKTVLVIVGTPYTNITKQPLN